MAFDDDTDEGFEIEVTDLRTGQRLPEMTRHLNGIGMGAFRSAATGDSTAWRRHAEEPPPPTAQQRQTRRRRQIGSLAALAALAVGLAVGLAGTPGALAPLAGLLHRQPTASQHITAQQASAYSGNTVMLVHTVPWGTVLLDGRPRPAGQQVAGLWQALTLPPGTHILEYDAPPFATLRCRVSIPASSSDTCPTSTDQRVSTSEFVGSVRPLDMGDVPEHLPAAQLATLVAQVRASLEQQLTTQTVPAGDHYLMNDGSIGMLRQDGQVTLGYLLAEPAVSALTGPYAPACMQLCSGFGSDASGTWTLFAQVRGQWRLSAGGMVIATMHSPKIESSAQLPIEVSWSGGTWHVISSPRYHDNVVCDEGTQQMTQQLDPTKTLHQLWTQPAAETGGGCLLQAQFEVARGQTSAAPEADFLYRLGVLLALNDGARLAIAGTPQATAHEQAIASRIAAGG